MSKTCSICGRNIKTGIKYCYVCRSIQRAGKGKKDNTFAWIIALTLIIYFIASLFSNSITLKALGIVCLVFGLPLLIILYLKQALENRKRVSS